VVLEAVAVKAVGALASAAVSSEVAVAKTAETAAVQAAPAEAAAKAAPAVERSAAAGTPPPKDPHLIRFGKGPESAEQLAADAAQAEKAGLPHGVSTKQVGRVSGTDNAHRSAPKSEVEKHFTVTQTGNKATHHTVELPKPVTPEVAKKFNAVFQPKKD
jgi:hypothetical protein